MKSRLLLISTILAATAGLGVTGIALSSPPDAPASTSARLGDHPAVIVARTSSIRGIDVNTFIVAHPARLQLLAASPSETDAKLAKSQAPASTAAAGR